ncbi:hypothetical protein AAAK29_09380 [Mesorhizobium sp. CCNWLW179-1]|uniref:hypothetical protein n=1 Tax=unclassified Mesorhizobium TaxID=325217 RepID=UPI0030145AF1
MTDRQHLLIMLQNARDTLHELSMALVLADSENLRDVEALVGATEEGGRRESRRMESKG